MGRIYSDYAVTYEEIDNEESGLSDETMATRTSGENEQLRKRIQELERETAEKEAIIQEKEKEEEKRKKAERDTRLEEELKTAQIQLATKDGTIRLLTENTKLKDIIMRDKERTIQMLSSQRS